jgi:undecaprenyl-diphosphatase
VGERRRLAGGAKLEAQAPVDASPSPQSDQEIVLTPFQAIILSLIQAVTEFLPISSSGHLILAPRLFGWPDQGLPFDVATNTGTLLAVLLFFRRDLVDLVTGFLTGRPARLGESWDPRRLALCLVLGTVPAGLAGLLFYDLIATVGRNPVLIGVNAVVFGLLLLWADRRGVQTRDLDGIGWREALLIGAAQALALSPGTSRSGITLTAALLLGFARPAAARFSFLLSIPIGVLAALLTFKEVAEEGLQRSELAPILLGIGVSAVAGYLVIGWLLDWLRRRTVAVFVGYRLLLGAVVLAAAAWL